MAQYIAFLDDLDHPQRDGGSHRMAAIGRGVREDALLLRTLLQPLVKIAVHNNRRDREIGAGQRLGQSHAVGSHAKGLAGEHMTGAAEARDHFIVEQQNAVTVQQRAKAVQVSHRRHDTAGAVGHRIQDHGADHFGAGMFDGLLDFH